MFTNSIQQTKEYEKLASQLKTPGRRAVALFGLPPTARAQVLCALCEETGRPAVVLCAGEADATRFAADCAVFGQSSEVFPSRDFVLRPVEGLNHEYEYRRLSVLGNLVGQRTRIVCAGVEAALQYTMPRREFCENTMTLKPDTEISVENLTKQLYAAGYHRRFQVEGPGQFSVRGGIVDIFAPDMPKPCRLEFWGDCIDTIHTFDLSSQRREDAVDKIYLSPAREVLFGCTEDAAALLRQALEQATPKQRRALEQALDRHHKQLDAGPVPGPR